MGGTSCAEIVLVMDDRFMSRAGSGSMPAACNRQDWLDRELFLLVSVGELVQALLTRRAMAWREGAFVVETSGSVESLTSEQQERGCRVSPALSVDIA